MKSGENASLYYPLILFPLLYPSPPSSHHGAPTSVLWVLPESTHSPTHCFPFPSMRGHHTMSPGRRCPLANLPLTSPVHPNLHYYFWSNGELESPFGKIGLLQSFSCKRVSVQSATSRFSFTMVEKGQGRSDGPCLFCSLY